MPTITRLPPSTLASSLGTPTVQALILEEHPFITVATGIGDNVILHAGPVITYAQLGLLKMGDEAAARGRSKGGDWICIVFSGTPESRAWIYAAYVKMDFVDLPVLDSQTGKVMILTPTVVSRLASQKGLLSIKRQLKQEDLNYQFLGLFDNLNHFSDPSQRVERYQVGSTTIFN